MRYYIITCLVIITFIQCKPVDRSDSEGKALLPLAKKLLRAGKKNEEILASVKLIVKNNDETSLDSFKKLIAKGGKDADEAILAFRRGYDEILNDYAETMREISRRYNEGDHRTLEISLKTRNDAIEETVIATNQLTHRLLNRLEQVQSILGLPKSKWDPATQYVGGVFTPLEGRVMALRKYRLGTTEPNISGNTTYNELIRMEELLTFPSNSNLRIKRKIDREGWDSTYVDVDGFHRQKYKQIHDLQIDFYPTQLTDFPGKFSFINDFIFGKPKLADNSASLLNKGEESRKLVVSMKTLNEVFEEEEHLAKLIDEAIVLRKPNKKSNFGTRIKKESQKILKKPER